MSKIRVWDLPTRVFHWVLVAAVAGLIITGNVGGNWMVWHMRAGHLVGALVLFRVVWGVVGGHWSRFSTFVPSPRGVLSYWRSTQRPPSLGHNPLGALSVLAMLAALTAQVLTGLVSDDEIAFSGPLYPLVSNQLSAWATWFHKDVGKLMLLALVVLHVLAIVYYQAVKKQRLVRGMLTGNVDMPPASPPLPQSNDSMGRRWLALCVFAACAAFMVWVYRLDSLG